MHSKHKAAIHGKFRLSTLILFLCVPLSPRRARLLTHTKLVPAWRRPRTAKSLCGFIWERHLPLASLVALPSDMASPA